jgi:hypothetical protein
LAASVRRARRASDVQARRTSAYVRWHQDDDGSVVGSFRLAPEQAAVFCHGLDAAAGRLPDVTGDAENANAGARQARSAADALAAMAEAYLEDVPRKRGNPSTGPVRNDYPDEPTVDPDDPFVTW